MCLFHLSEIIRGITPWVWFADVVPTYKDVITLAGRG